MVTSQEYVGIAIKYICVVCGARSKLIKNKDHGSRFNTQIMVEVNYTYNYVEVKVAVVRNM